MSGLRQGWRSGKTRLLLVWVLCCSSGPFIAGLARASSDVDVTMGAEVGYQYGYDRWHMTYAEDPAVVESELDWPLDFPMGGIALSVAGPLAQDKDWSIVFSFLTNMTNPSGTMDDSDWIAAEAVGLPRTLFSYTESAVQGHAFLFDLGSYFTVLSWKHGHGDFFMDVGAGYRHEYYTLNAQGAEGWQLNDNGEVVQQWIPEDIRAVHYEVNHMLPYLGIQVRNRFGDHFLLDGGVRMFGVITRDKDDHVLRYKEATGDAGGLGVGVHVAPRLVGGSSFKTSQVTFSTGLDLDFEYLDAPWGTLSQYFYGDDPGTPDDETGLVLPDSDWTFDSLMLRAMVVLEIRM